jgi:hypothetical protein
VHQHGKKQRSNGVTADAQSALALAARDSDTPALMKGFLFQSQNHILNKPVSLFSRYAVDDEQKWVCQNRASAWC